VNDRPASVAPRTGATRAARAGALALGGLALVLLVGCLVAAWPFTVDDTFITLRYSRNLAAGLGPTFNATGPRAEGYTTFLWMLLLAVPHALGVDAAIFAKAIGALATAAAAGIVAVWARSEARGVEGARGGEGDVVSAASRALGLWAGAVAAACFVSIPATAVHAVSGMETALFTVLLTGMFFAAAERVRGREAARWGLVACALLAGLTRPEGNLAAAVVVAVTALSLAPEGRRRLLGTALAGWVVPVAAYELWRRHYYGLTFPLPFYVKLATPGLLPGWPDVLEWLGGPALRFAVLLGPALLPFFQRAPETRPMRPALCTAMVLTGFFVLPQHQMGYDHRYLAPLDPTLAVLAGVGFARLAARGGRAVGLAAAGLAIALGVNLAGAPVTIEGEADYGRGLMAAHARLGRELRALDTPEGRLVISDAGATPYFSQWWTLDLIGLNDAHIATTGHPDPAWVLAQAPDVVVLASASTGHFETWDWNPWESALYDACLAAGFTRVAVRRFAPDYWLWVMARPASPASRLPPT
jgi:arabinofuranosyltransferase